MNAIQQTFTVPAGHRLSLELPQSVPEGTTANVTITFEASRPHRTGFLKGLISVPEDFDTMYQEEIIALFEGKGQP